MSVADPARSIRPPRGSGDLRTSLLLFAGMVIASATLLAVLEGVQWLIVVSAVIAVVLGAAALARAFLRFRWAGTLAATIATIVTLTVLFGNGTGILGIIPGTGTFPVFAQLAREGIEAITVQGVPADVNNGLLFQIVWPIAILTVIVDMIAIWWRTPALAGIPLLVIATVPSVVRSELGDPILLALLAVVYLLLLRPRIRRIQSGVAVGLGVVIVLGTLAVPGLLPAVTPAADTEARGSVATGINPIIDLGRDLRRGDDTVALTYTTTAQSGLYLRLTTLDKFVGPEWAPTETRVDANNTVAAFGTPAGQSDRIATEEVTSNVSVENAVGRWLPVPYPTESISGLQGNWFWEPDGLSVRSSDSNMRGQTYQITSQELQPTERQANAAVHSLDNPLAEVPDGLDPIVAQTAREVVGTAETDYAKALALQNWFRGPEFTYSESAPVDEGYDGSGIDVIPQFLRAKSGYCVHYASTMAIMARTLGIPSRIAVGFLPGTAQPENDATTAAYEVTSQDLHAWPELYFEGIGWQRFEPTPGRGVLPEFTPAPTDDPATPEDESTETPTPEPTTSESAAPVAPEDAAPEADAAATATTRTFGWTLLITLGALLILLIPAIARSAIRRGRIGAIRRGASPGTSGWEELADSVRDLGLDVSPGSTPREFVAQLTTVVGLSSAAATAIDSMRELVERESFARSGADTTVGGTGEAGSRDAAREASRIASARVRDLTTVLRSLRQRAQPVSRLRATFAPVTLLDRVLERWAIFRT